MLTAKKRNAEGGVVRDNVNLFIEGTLSEYSNMYRYTYGDTPEKDPPALGQRYPTEIPLGQRYL